MESVSAESASAERIASRHGELLARLRSAADAGGHDPAALRIVAVTKTWPLAVARAAVEAGLTLLGESRVQEAEPKVQALPDVEWHLVGRLQSNKARRAVRVFQAIHSVESIELLRRLDAVAEEEQRAPRLLLQVNVSRSPDSAGLTADDLLAPELVAVMRGLRAARAVGLMTIAPMGAGPKRARATFAALRELRDRLQDAASMSLPELSMGMTSDAAEAAAEGATLVRIGTALFGPRG